MNEAKNQTVHGHCPRCGPRRNAYVVGKKDNKWDDDEMGVWGHEIFYILQCAGCDSIYFRKDEQFSENWHTITDSRTRQEETAIPVETTYWPAPAKRETPEWFYTIFFYDEQLHEFMFQTYQALTSDSRILAAIGLRTAFD